MSKAVHRLVLIAILLLVSAGLTAPASAQPARAVAVADLGPASSVTSTGVAAQVGGQIWTATSGVSPVKVGAFDPTTGRVERTIDLPTGAGVWAMAQVGADLYVGTYTPGDLYKINTDTGALTKVANFGSFIWSLAAAPDGTILAGTYPDAGVHSYDPATGTTRSYGTVAPGEQYVRSIAVDDRTIYAGIGSHAKLITVDRASGATASILPAAYAIAPSSPPSPCTAIDSPPACRRPARC